MPEWSIRRTREGAAVWKEEEEETNDLELLLSCWLVGSLVCCTVVSLFC